MGGLSRHVALQGAGDAVVTEEVAGLDGDVALFRREGGDDHEVGVIGIGGPVGDADGINRGVLVSVRVLRLLTAAIELGGGQSGMVAPHVEYARLDRAVLE